MQMRSWLNRLLHIERPNEQSGANTTGARPPAKGAIWAVGGGKGGVGKSLVASSLAIALARSGKKVLAIDADLGAANLHTFFGLREPARSLSSYLKGEYDDISEVASSTGIANLDIVNGSRDSLDITDMREAATARLQKSARSAAYDHIILDTSPGTSFNSLDLFLSAAHGIVVTTPEPTSIENSYRFLKCLLIRKIRLAADEEGEARLKSALQKALGSGRTNTSISTILDAICEHDAGCGALLKERLAYPRLSIMVNQARSEQDLALGPAMERVSLEYFGVRVEHLATIAHEERVRESVSSMRPLLEAYPWCDASLSLIATANKLLTGNHADKYLMAT